MDIDDTGRSLHRDVSTDRRSGGVGREGNDGALDYGVVGRGGAGLTQRCRRFLLSGDERWNKKDERKYTKREDCGFSLFHWPFRTMQGENIPKLAHDTRRTRFLRDLDVRSRGWGFWKTREVAHWCNSHASAMRLPSGHRAYHANPCDVKRLRWNGISKRSICAGKMAKFDSNASARHNSMYVNPLEVRSVRQAGLHGWRQNIYLLPAELFPHSEKA
jgi:hypothetical protein